MGLNCCKNIGINCGADDMNINVNDIDTVIVKVGINQDIEIIEENNGTRTVRIRNIHEKQFSTYRTGDTFNMAGHEWIVLDTNFKTDSSYGIGVILKDFYTIMNFGISTDFAESNARKYLHDVVLDTIRSNIEGEIMYTIADSHSLDGQNEYIHTSCYIRYLTYDEARKYNQFLVSEDIEYKWWTCTPWSTRERGCDYDMVTIDPSGMISRSNCKEERCGVRPFCVLAPHTIV